MTNSFTPSATDLTGMIDLATQDAQTIKLGGFVVAQSAQGLFYLPTSKPRFVTEGVIAGLIDGAQLVGAFEFVAGDWKRLDTLQARALGSTT